MNRLTYTVRRRPGGWAVENGEEWLCFYRAQEQAIAHARQLGHDGWHEGGAASEILVESPTGRVTTEYVYGETVLSA